MDARSDTTPDDIRPRRDEPNMDQEWPSWFDGEAALIARLTRVERSDDFWEGYDPERLRQMLETFTPIWSAEFADRLIADIYWSREAGSRTIDRPAILSGEREADVRSVSGVKEHVGMSAARGTMPRTEMSPTTSVPTAHLAGPDWLDDEGEVLARLTRVDDQEDIWAGYDPERARQVLRDVAGSWSDLDTDQIIAELYEARDRGTRPLARP